jgi:hypothetical protein
MRCAGRRNGWRDPAGKGRRTGLRFPQSTQQSASWRSPRLKVLQASSWVPAALGASTGGTGRSGASWPRPNGFWTVVPADCGRAGVTSCGSATRRTGSSLEARSSVPLTPPRATPPLRARTATSAPEPSEFSCCIRVARSTLRSVVTHCKFKGRVAVQCNTFWVRSGQQKTR